MAKILAILAKATNIFPGHGPVLPMKAQLQTLTDRLEGDEYPGNYGEGEHLSQFEREVASVLDK